MLVKSPDHAQAQQDPQDPTANQALPDLMVNQAAQARTAAPAQLVHPAMLALTAMQAKLAALALPETLADLVPPAAASTAHRLVWLLAINRLTRPDRQLR